MNNKFFLDTRDPNLSEKFGSLNAAINSQDDLPCALICAAYIDKCLLGILESIFVSGDTAKKILKTDDGLLGGLYSRARLLYLMGTISKVAYENIGIICNIRNKFAHSDEPLSFESEDIKSLCLKLSEWSLAVEAEGHPAKAAMSHLSSQPKQRFIGACIDRIFELVTITSGLMAKHKADAS